MPSWRLPEESVRTSKNIQSALWAVEVHSFAVDDVMIAIAYRGSA